MCVNALCISIMKYISKKSTGKRIQCLTNVADRSIIMATNKNIIKKGYNNIIVRSDTRDLKEKIVI